MKRLLLILLALTLPFGFVHAEEAVIVQATDLHYLSPTLIRDRNVFMRGIESSDGKLTHYAPQIAAAFVARMLELRPDAVILSGDLTLNGAPVSHHELAELFSPLIESGVPVLAIPGNHDTGTVAYAITENGGEGFRGLTDAQFAGVYHAFGWDGARSRDAVSFSCLYEVTPSLWVLALDANANGKPGSLRAETLAWAEAQLAEAQAAGAQVISVTHQTLLPQQAIFQSGFEIKNSAEAAALLRRFGVRLNLSGHTHIQHVAQEDGLMDIAASALCITPCRYAVIRVSQAGIAYETEALDVSAWARAQGETDENLLDFAAYAQDFFIRVSANKMASALDVPEIDAETRARMLDFAVTLNLRYYTGTRSEGDDESGLALWQEYLPDSFHTRYMETLLAEPARDMNRVLLP